MRARTRAGAATRIRAQRFVASRRDPLLEGRDSGGRRDFLAGRPVHAGEGLYLLTCAGWHAVRHESNVPREPMLYMPLPGVREDVVLAVPREARFAWPEELRLASL